MNSQIFALPAGYRLSLQSNQGGGERISQPDGARSLVPSSGIYSLGPFADDRSYVIHHEAAAPTVTVAVATVSPLAFTPTTIEAGRFEIIPADHQLMVYGTFTVDGTLVVNGELRVAALPALT